MSEPRGPYEARTREQVGRELIATLVRREQALLLYCAALAGAALICKQMFPGPVTKVLAQHAVATALERLGGKTGSGGGGAA